MCTSLTSLTLPHHLAMVGEEAFRNCDKLNRFTPLTPTLTPTLTLGARDTGICGYGTHTRTHTHTHMHTHMHTHTHTHAHTCARAHTHG